MNEKTRGLTTAVSVWVSLERLIPQRFDTLADIYVPVLTCIWGIVGAISVWKGKRWGCWVLLVFSITQIIALGFVAGFMGYENFAKTRGVEFLMILVMAGASILLAFETPKVTASRKKTDSTTALNRTSQARSG